MLFSPTRPSLGLTGPYLGLSGPYLGAAIIQTIGWLFIFPCIMYPSQLSPGIILMSGGVHDGGILQSSLFTSRSQNQVSGKLRSSGFWS